MYLELDDVFAKFHILKKKKYAAVKAELRDGKITYTNEWKGLDLVRRDWAQLSSEMGK
jgi:DNA polymerase alpha subunit A